jgi:hypothetical protein
MADNTSYKRIQDAIVAGLRAPTGSLISRAERVWDALMDAGLEIRPIDPPVSNSAPAVGVTIATGGAYPLIGDHRKSEAERRADHLERCGLCREIEEGRAKREAARLLDQAIENIGDLPDRTTYTPGTVTVSSGMVTVEGWTGQLIGPDRPKAGQAVSALHRYAIDWAIRQLEASRGA